jgi:hypothetical protein
MKTIRRSLIIAAVSLLPCIAQADAPKPVAEIPAPGAAPPSGNASADPGGGGYRFAVQAEGAEVPVAVVGGTPYQMGWHLGRLMRPEMERFVPAALSGFKKKLQLTDAALDQAWATTSAWTDRRFLQELAGLAAGSGIPVRTLQHVHCLPLLMPYSCSSIAAWGSATADGRLYQTRNLDWNMEAGAHEFPVTVVYLPAQGQPHAIPTFAGIIGANCGMNAAGIVLSEMGDAPAREMPYELKAPHFMTWFRTILYDARNLTEALEVFRAQPQTKRYHFVFGDGKSEKRAVKIRAHCAPDGTCEIVQWGGNDPKDELAPHILPDIVYQDEGRGAFPSLKANHGKLDRQKMIETACSIPIKGGNVMNAVFDGTGLRCWVSYARGASEAYQRPWMEIDLATLDGDKDGRPDLEEGGADKNANGQPDFLEPATPRTASGAR